MSLDAVSIGEAARRSGLTVKMIRHYDQLDLVRPSLRSMAQYRYYSEEDLHRLRFVGRARRLGFSMAQIRELLALWQGRRPSREVKSLALAHVNDLERRIAELQGMRDTLKSLAANCRADARPSCPILEDLAVRDGDAKPSFTQSGLP
jgi:MerR family transcriptional regulator, copper efflux regulator